MKEKKRVVTLPSHLPIVQCNELSYPAKNIHMALLYYCKIFKNRVCWPSQEEVSCLLNKSIQVIRKGFKELRDEKIIFSERKNPKFNNTYSFNEDHPLNEGIYNFLSESKHSTDTHSEYSTDTHSKTMFNNRDIYKSYNKTFVNKCVREKSRTSPEHSNNPSNECMGDFHKQDSKIHSPLNTKPSDVLVSDVREVLLSYYDDYYIKSMPQTNTKSIQKDLNCIKKALNGTLYPEENEFHSFNRKFTKEEIILAIGRYALTLSSEYYPKNKKGMIIYLYQFFYNPYDRRCRSPFLEYLDREPDKILSPSFTGNEGRPIIVQKLLERMNETTLPPKEMDKLIFASEKIFTWFKVNEKNRGPTNIGTEGFMAKVLWDAVKEDVNGSMPITAGFFCSNKTFNYRLPKYCDQQGYFFGLDYKHYNDSDDD
uniref:Helix-turn-helix domain-containing protein n=1 Tax=viral metagenome TaxID=1070528 RepID=A0A6M3KLJ2_9ZZZZ